MTITEIITKYDFVIIRPDGVTESLYSSNQTPITETDREFIVANRPEIIKATKDKEVAVAAKSKQAYEEMKRRERKYDEIWNDGGEGYNPNRGYDEDVKVDTQD